MRWFIPALVLALTLGVALGYPLGGGNGAVNCTLFGAYKSPLPADLQGPAGNATKEIALTVDVGLAGAYNASYMLIDSKDREFELEPELTRELQPGRLLVGFVVPRDALFKLFRVVPNQGDATPISINWWRTPKTSNENVVLRYYGVLDQRLSTEEQIVAFEVGIQNNGTTPIPLSPENFTLLDQYGWEYYTLDGFGAINLGPQKAVKVKVNFSQVSPWSEPAALVYDYMTDNMLGINLERDTGPLTDAQVYGVSGSSPDSQTSEPVMPAALLNDQESAEALPTVQVMPSASREMKPVVSAQDIPSTGIVSREQSQLLAQLDAAKARIGSSSSTGSSDSTGINSTVESARERLAKVRAKLQNQQK